MSDLAQWSYQSPVSLAKSNANDASYSPVVQSSKSASGADYSKSVASFSDKEIADIKAWYVKKNYTKDYIKEIQRVVGTKDDGIIGKNTINLIRAWQVRNGLTADGKFGNGCAEHAGLKVKTASSGGSSSAGSSGNAAANVAASGKGINPAPLFQKQLDYPNSPYVSKADYNRMKKAMGDVPYASWNINDRKISGIYASAKKSNSGNSTIKTSGCGVTSLANLKGITPTASAEMSMQSGCRVYGAGTAASFMSNNGGSAAGNANSALKAVSEGKYLICSMGKGNWCSGSGHFILVYGFDGANVYVSDPYSYKAERAKASKALFAASYKYGYLF